MRRIRLTIAYDGTNYCGFQLQPELPTVEGELNRAIRELTGENITVIGASRTDSGVHAYGNVVVFDTASSIPAERFPLALQSHLPCDIRAVKGDEVDPTWHPRKTDCVKTYEYSYDCGRIEDPKQRLYSSFSRYVPDIVRMREAAAYLVGEHDFTSFANPSSQVLKEGGSAVRNIYSIEITAMQNGSVLDDTALTELRESRGGLSAGMMYPGSAGEKAVLSREADNVKPHAGLPCDAGYAVIHSLGTDNVNVIIRITGNGFLYNMVRIIAGTLMNVGTGLWEPERTAAALKARDRTKAGPTAEARGLTLMGISYPDKLTCSTKA